MDLDEDRNLVKSSTHGEHITLWNYCYINARRPNKAVDYKLVDIYIFGNYESFLNFDSGIGGGSDSESSFPYVFLRIKKITTTFDPEAKDVREVGLLITHFL